MSLPSLFLQRPIAHRGLHNRAQGRIENSSSAVRAAIDHGYGIEIDVQLSRDARAMVFHDYDMRRLTGQKGPIQQRSSAELAETVLTDGQDTIRTLPEILDLIAGQVPVIIELKDQDGHLGTNLGPLEAAVADALSDYPGPAAVMSFNPHSTAAMAQLCPDRPRGIVTSAYRYSEWPIPKRLCDELRAISDVDRVNASFISHEVSDLDRPRVQEIKASGRSILCWTVKSEEQAKEALNIADTITFEDFLPS